MAILGFCPFVVFQTLLFGTLEKNRGGKHVGAPEGSSYRKAFCPKFPSFFFQISLIFFYQMIECFVSVPDILPSVKFPSSSIGMLSVPEIFPSAKFPKFGNIYCFSWNKKEENLGKKSCSIRTALRG